MKSLHSIRILLGFVVFQSAASAGKPNVYFIVCDRLNTHVTTSGHPHIQENPLQETRPS